MIYFSAIILSLLPTYLIRFKLFSLPTTLLEILLVVFLFSVLLRIVAGVFRPPQNGNLKVSATIQKIKQLGKINYAIGFFALAGIISTFISPDKIHALGQLKSFIFEPILLFYAVILTIKTQEDIKLVLRWLFIAIGIISLFGIIQYFTFLNLPIRFWGTGLEVQRITSVFDYPNALALFLAPLFGFFFSLALSKYTLFKNKWLMPVGLLIQFIALLLTFSRGAWLAILVGSGFLLIRHFGWKKIIPTTTILLLILLMIPTVRTRISLGISDTSSQAHLDLMKVGVNKIIENPLLGNGLYGFRTTLQQASFQGEILNYPHNIFLNFWLELGLLGLLSFCTIIFLTFKQNKIRPSALTLATSVFMMILILHGLVDAPYFKNDLSVLFWFVVAVTFI